MTSENLIVQFNLEESDYVDAQRLMGAQTPRERLAYFGLTVLAAIGAVSLLLVAPANTSYHQGALTLVGAISGFWIAWVCIRLIYFPMRLKKLVQEQSRANRRFDMSWDDSGIVLYTPKGKRVCPWAGFTKWRDDSRVVLLYLADGCMQLVPRRFFPSVSSMHEFEVMVGKNVNVHEAVAR